MPKIDTKYLGSKYGYIKLAQVLINLLVVVLMCHGMSDDVMLWQEDIRLACITAVSFLTLVFNVFLFVANSFGFHKREFENICSIICIVLFVVLLGLLVWFYCLITAYDIMCFEIVIVLNIAQLALLVADVYPCNSRISPQQIDYMGSEYYSEGELLDWEKTQYDNTEF